ncbi:MAG TPA: bifunctional 4-hydroxy-2-oxoglutarate aldolase/2-dehydro-3-deoxy-phosphogluconate aldolase [Puia sp.]|jgi:2-dehydro-3-deoxyphosphogluconate aldolase/(4S)-4-hydroxy-2-oxoglutarate aldolase|nr:bifunctional 4-hydroxy-2-oxoglutarate aldolase/2-dehydro-3-deoxy-phosphogluconate aldolase [Puia sp.]
MKKYSKDKISLLLEEQGVLPMFSHEDENIAGHLLQALYQGGVRVVEFTNRSPHALKVFRTLKRSAAKDMPGLIMGAGTIMNTQAAIAYTGEGADFIVAPVIDKMLAKFCLKENILWCPGAATLTEIVRAHEMGAGLVKIFPAKQLGGPDFVKAIMAPCPWLRIMATGGISTERTDLEAWFKSGVKCVGIGSHLFPADLIARGEFELISARINEVLQLIQTFRA